VDRAVVQLGNWAQFCCGLPSVACALVYHTQVPDGSGFVCSFAASEARDRACALLGLRGQHDAVRF
jgi:hypothetical protein